MKDYTIIVKNIEMFGAISLDEPAAVYSGLAVAWITKDTIITKEVLQSLEIECNKHFASDAWNFNFPVVAVQDLVVVFLEKFPDILRIVPVTKSLIRFK